MMPLRSDIMDPDRARRLCAPLLYLPEGEMGEWKLEQQLVPAFKPLPFVTMRTAFLCGLQPQQMAWPYPRALHFLKQNGGTIMSDQPCEMLDQARPAMQMRGHTLIGGLGLGLIIHQILAFNKRVDRITVVEKQPEVISLVEPHLCRGNRIPIRVINADIFDYAQKAKSQRFDSAYMDTWTGTGESEWVNTIVPLRRLLVGRKVVKKDRIACWQENVMLGQLQRGLGALLAQLDNRPFLGWLPHAVFSTAALNAGLLDGLNRSEAAPSDLGCIVYADELLAVPKVKRFLTLFLNHIGEPRWERTFGALWDQFAGEANRRRKNV